jgi:hypothetical protein
MGKVDPLPATVQSAAVRVCRDALHWRGDLQAVFLAAGVPAPLYDKYDHLGFSKAKIARAVFNELQERGQPGFTVQRKIVQELCRMTKPHPDAPDQVAAKASLADLKHEATAVQILIDPEKAAADARRAASQRKVTATQQRRERIGQLREAFLHLLKQAPGTNADRQDRGYKLERMLADLFGSYDMEYRPSYKVTGEQIDGSFHFRGFTYIVEVRWRDDPPTSGDLLSFKAKVDAKMESTRGVFISMAGYGDDVLEHFIKTARGSRNNVILFDGRDVTLLFEGNIGLEDSLIAKIDAAEQEGRMWRPL